MPYIGKSPVGGGFHKLDNLTASATATYALTLGGAAYYPETANQLLVSLNGVIQAPQDSFTVSGSNLIFDTALTASDSIDFVVALGDVLGVGSVTDGAVTTNKISNGAVTAAKIGSSAVDLTSKVTGVLPVANGGTGTGTMPFFRAKLNGDQTVAHDTTTLIEFDTVEFDSTNDFNTATYRFTPSVAGYYFLNLSVRRHAEHTRTYYLLSEIRKNNSNISGVVNSIASGRRNSHYVLKTSDIVYANGTTDYFDATSYHYDYDAFTSVDLKNDGTQTVFSGHLVSAQ